MVRVLDEEMMECSGKVLEKWENVEYRVSPKVECLLEKLGSEKIARDAANLIKEIRRIAVEEGAWSSGDPEEIYVLMDTIEDPGVLGYFRPVIKGWAERPVQIFGIALTTEAPIYDTNKCLLVVDPVKVAGKDIRAVDTVIHEMQHCGDRKAWFTWYGLAYPLAKVAEDLNRFKTLKVLKKMHEQGLVDRFSEYFEWWIDKARTPVAFEIVERCGVEAIDEFLSELAKTTQQLNKFVSEKETYRIFNDVLEKIGCNVRLSESELKRIENKWSEERSKDLLSRLGIAGAPTGWAEVEFLE